MESNKGLLTNHQLGAFYTPEVLSTYVASRLIDFYIEDFSNGKNLIDVKVLDPACGDGALLKSFEKALISKLEEMEFGNIKDGKSSNVFGIDINEQACVEAELNLKNVLFYGRDQQYLVKDALTLMNLNMKNNKILPKELVNFFQSSEGVDCIITNPPWGADLNLNATELKGLGYNLATGQFDSYEVMVELSLSLLKPDGYMALILPDSIFLSEHKNFREFLLKNTTIKLMCRLGEGFFNKVYRSTVVLIIQNRNFQDTDKAICFNLNKENRKKVLNKSLTLLDVEREHSHLISQNRFFNDKEFKFDIDISEREVEQRLLKKIERYDNCWDFFDSGRGVEISKMGLLQICQACLSAFPKGKKETLICKFCGAENNLELQKIIDSKAKPNWEPVIAGEDVNRYMLKKSKYINPNIPSFNYKKAILKNNKNKLLIRKTGLGISASIDYQNSYTLQTVFHFFAKDNIPGYLNVEYLLGVINSRVLLYYHLKKSGETEWKSHPYVTQKLIKELPMPLINDEMKAQLKIAEAISNTVKKIMKHDISIKQKIELDLMIESYVIKLFEITREEYKIIEETINNAEQLKSISALRIPEGHNINFNI